jgi:hypothetical protein
MASAKGRHRRPSNTAKAISGVTIAGSAGITAAAIITAPGAQAQVLPRPLSVALHSAQVPLVITGAFTTVTVHSGDTLSGIAGKICGNPADWTGIWNYNHHHLGWTDPDVILPGQVVIPDCRDERVWLPQPAVTTAYAVPAQGGYQSAGVSTAGDGSFQACVITRESGGNPQVMNSSEHYGLYQFDYQTWISGGGNGADFGHASVAEQNRVFQNVYAARGSEPWAPSDGC